MLRSAVILLLCGCADRALYLPESSADLGAIGDLAIGDLAIGDLAIGDLARADLAVADLATADLGSAPDLSQPNIGAPRAISPLSTATVTSQSPIFTWELAVGSDGARLEICRDRACTSLVASADATGTSATVALTRGTYFWRLHGLSNGRAGSAVSPAWELVVGARSAAHDSSWGSFVDPAGNGRPDLLVGAWYFSGPTNKFGAWIFPDGANQTALTFPAGLYGNSVSSAGDINGDGYPDVIVGGYWSVKGTGDTALFLGGPNGLGTGIPVPIPSPTGAFDVDSGCSLANAGDLDRDGYADIIVGGCHETGGTGIANVYFGGPSGLSAPTTLSGSAHAVTGAGDLDGDGYADLAYGTHGDIDGIGTAWVVYGGPSGLSSPVTINRPDPQIGQFGRAVIAADLDGDGYSDLIVGATGAVYVYPGGPSGIASTPRTIASPVNPYFEFGAALGVGDFDGDGFTDLAVSAPSDDTFRGNVYWFRGGSGGVSTSGTLIADRGTGQGSFGYSLAGVGDIDGDGFADLLVGARNSNRLAGAACLYHGSASGFGSPTCYASPPNTIGFGASVAGAQ